MLRELNEIEMGMVSGGTEDGDSDLPDSLQGWERDWAERDPLVRSQILGGAGYTGDVDVGGTGEYVTHQSDDSGQSDDSSLIGSWICGLVTVPCVGDNQGGTPPK